jgi:hypothetical protein
MQDAVSSSFTDSYQLGKGAKILTAGDEEWIKRATSEEIGYVSDLADRLADPDEPEIDIDFRSSNYAKTLDSVSWNGRVESLDPSDEIYWKLGNVENCEDCILLNSQSPFNKDSLPTTPKAGSTDCHFNCRCSLVFKRGQLKPEDALDPSDRERIQGQTLNDFLSPKAPPKGLRIPTDIERGEIDTITAEMNYYRRLIGTGELQGEALKDAIKSRSSLNASLIDYTEERGIWDSPLLSVDDVITEAKFPLSAESELFLNYGVDGATLDLTTSIKIEKLIGEFEKDYGKEFTDVKKEYTKPEVKSKDKKKKKTK